MEDAGRFALKEQTMKGLFKSRKFQLLILDTVISLVTFVGGYYLAPEHMEFVAGLIAIIQPVFVIVIKGITDEDVAKLAAGTHISQQ